MAQTSQDRRCEILLRLVLAPKDITEKGLQDVAKDLKDDIHLLQKHIASSKDLAFAHITDVKFENACIFFKFEAKSEKELLELFECTKEPYNILSNALTSYFDEQSLQFQAGLQISSRIKCAVQMTKKECLTYQLTFFSDEGGIRSQADSSGSKADNAGNKKEQTPEVSPEGKEKTPNEGMYTRHTDENMKTNTEKPGVPLIQKIFRLYFNQEQQSKVKQITIESEKCRALNHELKSHRCYGLYELKVSIPADKIELCNYRYNVVWKSRIFTKETVEKSKQFLINENIFQRDIWIDSKKKPYRDHIRFGIIAHLHDILFHDMCTIDIKDSCKQIEDACKEEVMNDVALHVMMNINKAIYATDPPKIRLLFLVAAGKLLHNPNQMLSENVLDIVSAQMMVNQAQEFCLDQIPASCRMSTQRIYLNMCRKIFGQDKSLLKCIYKGLSFFEDIFILEQVLDCIKSKQPLCNDDKTSLGIVNSLCTKLYHEAVSQNSVTACQILEIFLRNLPLRCSVSAFAALQKDDTKLPKNESSVQNQLYGNTSIRIDVFLTDIKKSKNVQSLVTGWKDIIDTKCIEVQLLAPKFEDALLFVLELRSIQRDNIPELISCCIEKYGLFQDESKLHTLLKVITKSQITEVLNTFFLLSESPMTRDMYSTLSSDHVTILCQNLVADGARVCNSRDDRIRYICTRLSKVWNVPQIKARSECVLILKDFLVREFEKFKLEELLTKVEFMEELSGEDRWISYVFKEYYSGLIKGKSDLMAEEVLNWFPKTDGETRADLRLTAELVCILLEMHDCAEDVTIPQYFVRLVTKYKFWLSVIGMKGKHMDIVRNNQHFSRVNNCIENMVDLFRTHSVRCDFVECFQKNPVDANAAKMLLSQKCERAEIDKCWQEALSKFKEVKEELILVHKVLTKVADVMKEEPPIFEDIIYRVEDTQHALSSGNLTTKECLSSDLIWKGINKLPSICGYLEPLIASSVFWNVCLENVVADFNFEIHNQVEDDPLDSLNILFQQMAVSEPLSTTTDKNSLCILFMSILHEKGCQLYGDIWKMLLKDEIFPIQRLDTMFGKSPNINAELEIARKTLHIVIDESDEKTLKRIFSIDDVVKTVDAIKAVAKVFSINQLNDPKMSSAMEAFQKLINGTAAGYSFREVKASLTTVYSITEKLSEETVMIMTSLGNSSTLVKFLKSIVDEDIKNLIDAVEDISEQQVTESTVSALIEVKKYLHPLLLSQGCGDCSSLLRILEKQTNTLKKHAGSLPQKIEDCVLNMHNLKSLYNGVANRGEQTKEMIKNIISRGNFQFVLNELCTGVDFEVTYKQNRNKETHKKPTLIDLRSRALLLMNTERTNPADNKFKGEELLRFTEDVVLCLDISETLFELHMSGHIEYMNIKEPIRPKELLTKQETFSLKLRSWLHDVNEERYRHYLMNFVQGNQLHSLYRYLEQRNEDGQVVQTILSFIHPKLQAQLLKDLYQEEKTKSTKWSNRIMLHCIGHSLHSALEGLGKFYRPLTDQKNKSLSSTVKPGKLSVIQLEEGSFQTVRTLLALFLNTTERLPEPNHVLFCTRDTSIMELELLIHRCLGANKFYGEKTLFCIVNVDVLPNEVQFNLVETLRCLDKETKFLLAIICRGSRNHPFIDQLGDCVTSVTPATEKTVRDIFRLHCSDVVTVSSDIPGLGKTSYIKKVSHQRQKSIVTLHISGPIRKVHLVERINALRVKHFHVLHIDVGNVDDPSELDTFLFELVVLRYVSTGRMSVSLQIFDVYIEISNTINDTLRNSLQTAVLFHRENLNWKGIDSLIISKETNSAVQIVCLYLKELERDTLDTTDMPFRGDLQRSLSSKKCKSLLKKYVPDKINCSYPILDSFIHVLADQLKKMSESSFFKVSYLKDMMGEKVQLSVKTKLVQAMIEASSDFATRSIDVCREGQISTIKMDIEEQNHCTRTTLQHSNLAACGADRVEGMVRWEESNHLMFVFHNQNIHTLSPLYRHLSKVPVEIRSLFEGQIKKPMEDFRKMDQWKLQNILQKIARVNPMSLPAKTTSALSKTYAVTADNLLKMVLIISRIKANIPVVVMGETGCGKTSLVRYLAAICEAVFDVMNVHAGILEEEIIERVLKNNYQALEDTDSEVWLFLDEINTSDSIGLIANIICHHECLGKELSPNLVIMGACNPYKLRTTEAIHTAGLDGKAKTDELSRLVYRVLPLPEMMVDFVWDFGSLSEKDEREYIHRMIADVFPPENSEHHQLFTTLLTVSQAFVRQKERSSYSVSLRDVQRCKLLTNWFLLFLPKKKTIHAISKLCDVNLKSMILALAHCYQSRFYDKIVRRDYRSEIGNAFKKHGHAFDGGQEIFIQNVIREEQVDILGRMKLPPGTACNTALRENVFVILVCIFNRIPIFVVGKPGCSKSLAMQLIKSNLRGKDSEDEFFRELPQLYCVSFQGSESSTSDGIIKVFAKAKNYQNSNNQEEVLSVVVLDEIGLAEISRFNPLKVLHNLLEPDGNSQPDVAVVGISNWALDASKMNRAVHLSRPDMDEEELFDTAISISQSFLEKEEKEKRKSLLSQIGDRKHTSATTCDIRDELKGMSKAYYQYILQLRFKHFHGLRDYYSLIKFVARTFAEQGYTESKEIKTAMIIKGIARNFGGLPDEMKILYDVFRQHLPLVTLQEYPLMDLITENIQDPIARHLMLITTGESVLGLIEQRLKAIGCDRKEIIFGSQFEEDLTEDYNYRILSRIILCMEEGMVLILKDLDNIYGSLYDMLNQNYTVIGKKKNCRVALGPYSNPICHVAETFKCIVLIDKSRLDFTDPPFLNRFEKQYLRFCDIIQEKHYGVICRLDEWIDELTNTGRNRLEKEELFPVFNNDLTASLVLKAEEDIAQRRQSSYTDEDILAECKELLIRIMKPEIVIRQKMAGGLKTHSFSDEIIRQYFALPIHNGLEYFILNQIETSPKEELNEGLLNVVFTSSNVHSKSAKALSPVQIQVEKLGTFKSEKQLSSRIQHFWYNLESSILVVQCNAKDDGRHLLLTKQVIERYRSEYKKEYTSFSKHVYLVIHVNRNKSSPCSVSQLNFLSEWKLVMIDSIECPHIPLPKLHNMTLPEAVLEKRPLKSYLQDESFWAFSRIRYGSHGRDLASISEAIANIEHSTDLLEILENEILSHVQKQSSGSYGKYWQLDVACDYAALTSSSSFVDALELCVMDTIKIPLAKFIYKIEQTGILNSFFTCQHNDLLFKDGGIRSKRTAWISGLHDERLFSIADVPDETGPECYTCETVDFSLRMPFSLYIYESIESTKEDFMETLQAYRIQCLLTDDEDTPSDVYNEVLLQQENIILNKVPDLNSFTYENWDSDYIDDFCKATEHTILLNTVQMNQTMVLKLILERLGLSPLSDPFSFVLRLHTMVWVHYESIRSELLLIGKCLSIMPESKSEIMKVLKRFEGTTDPQFKKNTGQSQMSLSEERYGENINLHEKPYPICTVDSAYNRDVDSDFLFNEKDELSDQGTAEKNDYFSRNVQEGEHKLSFDPTLNEIHTSVGGDEVGWKPHYLPSKKRQDMTRDEPVGNHEICKNTCWDAADESAANETISPLEERNIPLEDGNCEHEYIMEGDGGADVLDTDQKGKFSYERNHVPLPEKVDGLNAGITITVGREICTIDDLGFRNTNQIVPECGQEPHSVSSSRNETEKQQQIVRDEASQFIPESTVFNKNDSKNEMSVSDALVQTVCMHMLPTSQCLKQHRSVHHWQSDVSSIISLAAKVSRFPNLLYSLRICTELVADLILPLSLDVSLIENLGDVMVKGYCLDSEHVFAAILDITESALSATGRYSEDIDLLCQRTLSSYFVRCLSADPDSLAFHFLFKLILESKIPTRYMKLYKVPVSLFFQSIHEDLLTDILSTDLLNENEENKGCPTGPEKDISIDRWGKAFLFELDDVLKHLIQDSKQVHVFIILLTDLLQDIYANEFPDLDCEAENIDSALEQRTITIFYKCHKTLQEYSGGLKRVASISFCVCFVQSAAHRLQFADEEICSELLSILDVALADLPEKKHNKLTEVFLKNLISSRTIIQLQKFCIKQGEKYTFLKNLVWEERDSARIFDKSPLCVHISEMSDHNECFCCKNMDINKFKKEMVEQVKNAKTNIYGTLQMLSFIMSQFYLQLTDSDIDDTRRREAELLHNMIAQANYSAELETLAKCMLGEGNFNIAKFVLTNTTPLLHVSEISVLTSLYSLLLSHFEFMVERDRKLPVLVKCLVAPESTHVRFLPGWTHLDEESFESEEKSPSHQTIYFGNCQCGFRIAFVGLQSGYECVICKNQVEVAESDLRNETKMKEFSCMNSNVNIKMNPVTKHLLQFLINGCLLGSIALGFSSEHVIADILSVRNNSIETHLAVSLDTQWKALKMCLNMDDNDLKALMHVIFMKAEKQICCNIHSFETVQDKKDWENSFEQEILPIVSKRYTNNKTVLRQHYHIHNNTVETVNKQLFEIDDITSLKGKDNVGDLPALYRIRSGPNKTNFVFELYTFKKQFPLLWDILQNEEMLKLPVHISSIVQWHNATVANASYMLKRHNCLKMTAQDFICFKQESMKKDVMKKRFDEFTRSWDILRSSMKNTELSKNMTRIHSESKISDILILGEESITFKVLQYLIKIQNGFFDNILRVASSCKGLAMLERDGAFIIPAVKAAEAKEEELLKCDIDWESILKQESQCEFEYGCGKHIHYDFCSIEEIVSRTVITGKSYIISQKTLPAIVFVDELHRNYASLLKELRTNVTQRPLPVDVSSGLNRRKDEDPRMSTELLNHLGIVMTVLKKTGGDPDQSLVEYVDSWQSIMCRNFPKHLLPSPESNIKLCHIVAINELLEELSADSVKEGLGDEYRERTDAPVWDHVLRQLKDQKLSLTVCKALKRFIYRCLASKTADPKQVIRVYLSDASFWPMGMCEKEELIFAGETVHLKDILPDGLRVCHIYDFLTLIETENERQKQGNIRLSGFATSFHARTKETTETKSAQRRKKIVAARIF